MSSCDVQQQVTNHFVPPPDKYQLVAALSWLVMDWLSWASAEIFPKGATSTFRLSFFRLRKAQCKWTFTKRFTFSRPQRQFPMKAITPFAFVWNSIQVELYSCLRIGRTFLSSFTSFAELGNHPTSILLLTTDNWVWIGLEISTSAFAVLTIVCAGWTSLLKI